jgi:hypothetical protein
VRLRTNREPGCDLRHPAGRPWPSRPGTTDQPVRPCGPGSCVAAVRCVDQRCRGTPPGGATSVELRMALRGQAVISHAVLHAAGGHGQPVTQGQPFLAVPSGFGDAVDDCADPAVPRGNEGVRRLTRARARRGGIVRGRDDGSSGFPAPAGPSRTTAKEGAAASTPPTRVYVVDNGPKVSSTRAATIAGPATGNPKPGSSVSTTGVSGLLPFAKVHPTPICERAAIGQRGTELPLADMNRRDPSRVRTRAAGACRIPVDTPVTAGHRAGEPRSRLGRD